jgi:putative MATE family efflux protein
MTNTTILQLCWPIFIENFLRISLTSVDVFQLSMFSSDAAAAVGLINSFTFFIVILYQMVTTGASIVISQNLGAKRDRDATLAGLGSVNLVVVFALVLSAAVVCFASPLLSLYKLESAIHDYALQFLVVYGAGSVFMAMNMVQGSIMRAYGHTREPMYVNILANALNILGNFFFLFGPLDAPLKGAMGVAISTIFSQLCACVTLQLLMRRKREIGIKYGEALAVPRRIYRDILAIGVPTAGENLSYNLAQIVNMAFITSLGKAAMQANVYSTTLVRFVFIASMSIGAATQIMVGHFVGAGLEDKAYKDVFKYHRIGLAISLGMACLLNLLKPGLLSVFRPDAQTLGLCGLILLLSILYEPGRSFNLIFIPGLKGSGDVKFPVFVGIISMWGIGVLGAYLLGIVLKMGLVGIYVAMMADEWIRGIIMAARWKSGAWRGRALVKRG